MGWCWFEGLKLGMGMRWCLCEVLKLGMGWEGVGVRG